MTLATADADGRPSARTVLLKQFDERGAVFHTNRLSRKGNELTENPRAALLFFWDVLERQIRIEGAVSAVGEDDSDTYFKLRPRGSRIGAWASQQSQPVPSRMALEAAVADARARFEGEEDVPRPPHWGGYCVALGSIEFWQGGEHRLHDRIVYRREGHGRWQIERLFP